jgi:hypothetical protein
MVSDNAGVSGKTQDVGARVRCGGEAFGDDRDRRPPMLLELDGVVETPRNTGPSVTDSVDDGVARFDESLDDFRG